MSQQKLQCIVRRLRDNDPTLTELDFRNVDGSRSYTFESESPIFHDLLDALKCNVTVTSVNIILRFLSQLQPTEKHQLFELIGSLPQLKQLRVGCSGLAGQSLRLINHALNQTRNLESLTLHSIHFKDNVHYKTESVVNTADEEYIEFTTILKTQLRNSLEIFVLEDVEDTFDLDGIVNALHMIPNLREVTIRSYSPYKRRLTSNSVEKLFRSSSLQTLALRRLGLVDILPDLLVSLDDNKVLKKLSLEQNGMNHDCGMAIAYLLGTNDTLAEIQLGYNLIPDACGSAIAGALSNNKSLKSLDFTANGLETLASRRFAHLLVDNECALEYLNLSQNSLRDDGVAMLASALEGNTTLKSLSLAETQITLASCAVLAASLRTNSTLQRLNIADNRIRDDGCISLANALISNSSLTSLNLCGNQIGNDGAVRLARSLGENERSALEKLNLANNHAMTHKSYDALEELVLTNYTLKHLWMPTVVPGSVIPSFIRLNRLGRKRLMQELDNAQLWVDAVKASSSDIHCLYFLVRSNPALVSWIPWKEGPTVDAQE